MKPIIIKREIGTTIVMVEQEEPVYEEVEVSFPFYRCFTDGTVFSCVFQNSKGEVKEARVYCDGGDGWKFSDFNYTLNSYHLAFLLDCQENWTVTDRAAFLDAVKDAVDAAIRRGDQFHAATGEA